MIARGNRRRSTASRASSAAASGSGPSTTETGAPIVVIALLPALRANQPQLAQARRLLDGDRVVVREAGVAEPLPGPVARAVDGLVHPLERQVAERVGAHQLANLVDRARRGEQVLARRRVDAVVARSL